MSGRTNKRGGRTARKHSVFVDTVGWRTGKVKVKVGFFYSATYSGNAATSLAVQSQEVALLIGKSQWCGSEGNTTLASVSLRYKSRRFKNSKYQNFIRQFSAQKLTVTYVRHAAD